MPKYNKYDVYQNSSIFWKGSSYNVKVTPTGRVWLSSPFNSLNSKPLSKKEGAEIFKMLNKSF